MTVRDDRVLRVTRLLAIVVIPFLIVASIVLYFMPDRTGELFAWAIKPSMTAMMLGAAYMGGIYFFARVVLARQWHVVKAGFLPVTTFASLLGIATLLHWDKFTTGHISFITWAGLYFTTPFLVVAVWLSNRRTDPREPSAGSRLIPAWLRWAFGLVGGVTLAISLLLFLQPQLMIAVWPWTLTPLTARVVGAMFALPGLVGLCLASDRRWSAALIILQAQALSIGLILVAVLRAWSDFDPASPAIWLFVGGLGGLLIGIGIVYALLERKQKIV